MNVQLHRTKRPPARTRAPDGTGARARPAAAEVGRSGGRSARAEPDPGPGGPVGAGAERVRGESRPPCAGLLGF